MRSCYLNCKYAYCWDSSGSRSKNGENHTLTFLITGDNSKEITDGVVSIDQVIETILEKLSEAMNEDIK